MSQPLPQRYGAIAQAGHWLTLLLVIGAFALGWIMSDMKMSPTRLKLFSYHKWIGVTIFGIAVLRLLWRQWAKAPPLPPAMPAWERIGAHLSHWGLYALLFAIPLSGWLMSSAKGFQTVYLGMFPIPDLIGRDRELGKLLEDVHELLTTILLFVVGLHAAAALKHHFFNRDDVLTRMLPRWRKTGDAS